MEHGVAAEGHALPRQRAAQWRHGGTLGGGLADMHRPMGVSPLCLHAGYTLPKIYRKVYYSISAAIHSKVRSGSSRAISPLPVPAGQ
jgi:hypothetical protein